MSKFTPNTGLKINRSKCQSLGINHDEETLSRWAGIIGCEVGSFLSSYLGLPLGGNLRALFMGFLY